MKINIKFDLFKVFLGFYLFFVVGCAQLTNYTLEDVEKQRLKSNNGDKKALILLSEIYKDNNQPFEVRLLALKALSESRDPQVINDIQSSVSSASFIELDLMKESIQILIKNKEISSIDSLIASLSSTEEKMVEVRTLILDAVGEFGTKDEIQLILQLYDFSKKSNAQMNTLLSQTLGEIGDDRVIPILMEIAKNKYLSASVRNRAVEVLSKKQAPELVDFFIEMLGDPASRDKVNEYAFDVMGEIPEERMLLALVEAYQVGRHKYYSLLNTVMQNLENYDNPEIKSIYLEIAQTSDFPSNIRLKAFKGLMQYSDPEVISGVVQLLNDSKNYIYHNEIMDMLYQYEVYDLYQKKLRIAAFKAMKKDLGYIDYE